MSNMIKFEMRKLFSSKAIYICSGVVVFIIALTAIIFSASSGSAEMGEETYSGLYMLITAMSGASMDLVLAVLIPLCICNEFSDGMTKSIVGRGYSRGKLYISKYITSIICTLILSIVCWITGFLLGTIFWGIGKGWSIQLIPIMLSQLIVMLVVSTASFLFAIVIRKTAGAIAMGILMPSVVVLVLSLVDNIIKNSSFQFSDYWISTFLMEISNVSVKTNILSKTSMFSILYILIFLVIGYICLRKSEV